MQLITAYFRFYEELNDFLTPERRKKLFPIRFAKTATVKDMIESLGVPHSEVDLILVNSISVNFSQQLNSGDHVSVYPVFESFNIKPIIKLRAKPLRKIRFVLDVHLGKLARYLRLVGLDTLYKSDYGDKEIIAIAQKQKRIILTRDIGLLKNKNVTHGYWLRETNPKKQWHEVLKRFDLKDQLKPFTRCLECNEKIIRLPKQEWVKKNIPHFVKNHQKKFYQCKGCKRIYWHGSHYQKLEILVKNLESPIAFFPLDGK